MNYENLMNIAADMRTKSYAPYSKFHVGAALLAKSGKIYTGCNVENSSFGATNCAERTAFFKAVSEGERDFSAIAIVGGPVEKEGDFSKITLAPPCGICRQVMREFCKPDFEIILYNEQKGIEIHTLKELLPLDFGPENL